MTNPNELVSKYLKKVKARTLPDGSPHPDDLREAEFLATVELLETGEIEPPEDSPPLSNIEAIRLWLETAKALGNEETVLEFIAHAVHKHDKQVRNAPINRGRLPSANKLADRLKELLGAGMKQPRAIEALAEEYHATPSAIYQKLGRGGYKLRK